MEIIQIIMKLLIKPSIFLLFLISISFSKSKSQYSSLHDTWRSTNGSKYRVWFQDWSEYTRLFITINEDTLSVLPNKYAAVNRKKPHLYPKPYNKILKRQIIGNIEWDDVENVSWKEGDVNTFRYIVDRSNPKSKLPILYQGKSVKKDGVLQLELFSNSEPKYFMELIPTSVE